MLSNLKKNRAITDRQKYISYSYKNIDQYLQQRNLLLDSFLLSDIDINNPITEKQENLLQIAIICKNIQAIKIILNKNASIFYCNKCQLTSLDIASEQCDNYIIKLLIENLQNNNNLEHQQANRNTIGVPALYTECVSSCSKCNVHKIFNSLNICILNKNFFAFQLIFSYIKSREQYQCNILYLNHLTDTLINACIHQTTDIVQFLLTQNININEKNQFERTPLNESCIHKSSLQFLNFLIQNGADLNIQDKFGNTPLLNCIQYGYYKIAQFLLKFNGINVNQANYVNQTPLLQLCNFPSNKQSIKLLKKLIKKQSNFNFQNLSGESALIILTKNHSQRCPSKRHEFIQILIDNGANINLQDHDGNTCLVYSCIYQDFKTFDWLLSLYPDFEILNKTLLILCQQNNYLLLQQFFLHNISFNINQQDLQGKNLLMHSLINLNQYTYQTFDLLINRGCKIDIQDKYQKDILDYTVQLCNFFRDLESLSTPSLTNTLNILFYQLKKYKIDYQLQFYLKFYNSFNNKVAILHHINMMYQKQIFDNFFLFKFLNKKKSRYLTTMCINTNPYFKQSFIHFCHCQLIKQ